MDLFRSKKREPEVPVVGEAVSSGQKKRRGLYGSLDNLLDTAFSRNIVDDDNMDVADTATDDTASSESECEEVNKVSKTQKIFAKRTIKRQKQREKDHRRKVEKNLISMEDFLSKQTEFKTWLYEEKNKKNVSSPKLKAYFKLFVRLWNKRKLPAHYYRSSSITDSPTPLTPTKCNFMAGEPVHIPPLAGVSDGGAGEDVKEAPTSPFVTFGKTPPKVLRSRKMELFGMSPDVALISVVPISSPVPSRKLSGGTDKENNQLRSTEQEPYRMPVGVKPRPLPVPSKPKPTPATPQVDETPEKSNTFEVRATPYKVSVFPWAVSGDESANHSLEVCTTDTPPNTSFAVQDESLWPPPPTESELNTDTSPDGVYRTNDSPNVPPPPPPPRTDSIKSTASTDLPPPPMDDDYSDPFDKVSDKETGYMYYQAVSEYHEPVDAVRINSSNSADSGVVIKSLSGCNEEPDLSLYSKPLNDAMPVPSVNLEDLYAKPIKPKPARRDALEDIYSKPLKRPKQQEAVKKDYECELYSEIMAHMSRSRENLTETKSSRGDPDYETIDDCMAKIQADQARKTVTHTNNINTQVDPVSPYIDVRSVEKTDKSKVKKKTVLAASSDKIYETYLSLSRKQNPFQNKNEKIKSNREMFQFGSLKHKYKSQPDISFSDSMGIYDSVDSVDGADHKRKYMSSFGKYLISDTNHKRSYHSDTEDSYVQPNVAQRAMSYEHGFQETIAPGTPTILATPSFESLCAVTPLSQQSGSGSSQSLPILSTSPGSLSNFSSMSTSSQSISSINSIKSGSSHSLNSTGERALSPVLEETESPVLEETEGRDGEVQETSRAEHKPPSGSKGGAKLHGDTEKSVTKEQNSSKETFNSGMKPMTPGKINAAKHGIDWSQYLLKPTKPTDSCTNNCNLDVGEQPKFDSDKPEVTGKINSAQNVSEAPIKSVDTHTRLAIRDNISGVKTKLDKTQGTNTKEPERRRTVQTFCEMRAVQQTPPTQVPIIGISSMTRKTGTNKTKFPSCGSTEPESKKHCHERRNVLGGAGEQYLETDLDVVLADRSKQSLRKSKSHSGFDCAPSTVVTDIW